MPDLTDRRARVVDALVAGLPTATAAEQCGVARRTVCYWLKDPAFQAAVAARRQEVAGRVADELAEVAFLALRVVKAALMEGEPKPQPKDAGPRQMPLYVADRWPMNWQVRLAKELVLGMGLLAVRPTPRGGQNGGVDTPPPRLEGERVEP